MKKIVLGVAMSMPLFTACNMTNENANDKLIGQMTLEEKAAFVIGTVRIQETPPDAPECIKKYPMISEQYLQQAQEHGINSYEDFQDFVATFSTQGRVQGAAGQHYEIPRLGLPAYVYADGPAGLRIDAKHTDDDGEYYCTAFPTETALAASWDTELVERVTTAMGEEVREYGCDVLLAPAINIHRSPLCGRNFEYFSEDPYLVGKMAVAYINGIQKNGVGTSLKHFAVNNQETHRNGIDAKVDMRTLREIYLKGFEIAVKESQPWTIMSSYNKINGVFASENHWLLTEVLRNEWGYQGFVMTDWWAQENGVRQQLAGNDLIMPGTQRQYDEILAGLKDGSLPEEVVNQNIRRILNVMQQCPTAQGYSYNNKPDLKSHAEITHQAACDGMILLENNNATLPIANDQQKVALFGNASYDILVGGSGSGNVNRKYKVSLLDGFKNANFGVNEAVAEAYKAYLDEEKKKKPAENFWTIPVFDELKLDEKQVVAAMNQSDVAFFTICRMAGEGGDRKYCAGDYLLNDVEAQNLALVSKVAHAAGKKVVVLLNMGNIIDMNEVLANKPDAVLHVWLGGQEAGNSIVDVVSGKVCPSGRLPMTWARKYEDYAASSNFPFSEGDSIVRYEEGIYVGYRQFDKDKIAPLYPFGYGLSYTSFAYSDMSVADKGNSLEVSLTVTNTGACAGREVIQIYVSAPSSEELEKPVKELKAFGKTQILEPGASEVLMLSVSKESLASWNMAINGWQTDKGTYVVAAATNAQNIVQKQSIEL